MSGSEVLSAILATAATFGLAYLALATAAVIRHARRRTAPAGFYPAVTVLKPLHGAEPLLFENLSALCKQDYPGEIQLVCGVQDPADPAIAMVRRLQATFPACRVDLVVEARLHGANRKVSNLVNMDRLARHPVVVLADSDMAVGPDYLRRLVDELARPGVGAVTCLYHGLPASGAWSRLSALAIDAHFLPGVAVGIGLGLAKPCFGSTIALSRDLLDKVGGFRALADELADDYVLGERVREAGLRVAVTSFTIGHVCPEPDLAALLRHELRWARTIRRVDPVGHAGSIVAHPFALALLGFFVEPSGIVAAIGAAALAGRAALLLAVGQSFGLRDLSYRLIPARDLLSFAVFVASFLGRDVSWRGRRYDVTPRGVMTPRKDEALNPR